MSWEELFEKHQGHAKRYTKRLIEALDLRDQFTISIIENAALFGIYKAALRYDPALGYSFVSYAYTCMRRHVYRHLKREQVLGHQKMVSMPEDYRETDNGGDEQLSIDALEVIAQLRENLTTKQRTALQYYFVEQKTGDEVAQLMGTTRQAVSALVRTIQFKARHMAQDDRIEGRTAKRRNRKTREAQ